MKGYRFELILAVIFLIIFMIYWKFVTPNNPLTKAEVAAYVAKIDAGLNMPEPQRTTFLKRIKTWGEGDDGEPVYLANIFHGNSKTEMDSAVWKGLKIELKEDGLKTHDVYLNVVKGMILPKGVWPAIGTKTQGVGNDKTNIAGFYPGFDEWTEININRYPSRRTILELFSDPKYLEVMPYKLVGLRLITVPTTLRFQIPDLRLAMGSIFLITLLGVGWYREYRRKAKK